MPSRLKQIAKKVYAYHNLGSGVFPEGEEKTPHGHGERYNFDRMYMMVSHYDFHGKRVLDLGCNSGWFCIQAKLLGAGLTVGVDYDEIGIMGPAIKYAMAFEKQHQLGITFLNSNLENLDVGTLPATFQSDGFDATLVLSMLHHIGDKDRLFRNVYDTTREVVFYEDHEFWNDLDDDEGRKIAVRGEGYRYGWNEDITWQRRMRSLASHEARVLDQYRNSWRRQTLLLDEFREIRLLGFSEKRRPMLALFK